MGVDIDFSDCKVLPQVAMPFMNTVHCEELTLVGELLRKVAEKADPAAIDAQLIAWVQHTDEHFAREERLMDEYNFFAYPMHRMEHERALQQLREVQQQWLAQRDYNALADYILYWREWLQQHVASMDFATAYFLSQFNIEVKL